MKVLLRNFSVLTNSHVIGPDGLKHNFAFEISSLENGSLIGHVTHRQGNDIKDDVGALYYVVAVIFIYSLSILMIIASYIRKNKSDRKLNRYLKEMANLRKREFQMQLYNIAAGKNKKPGHALKQGENMEEQDTNSENKLYTPQLKYIQEVKPRRLNAYSPKNAKMVLELPPCSYTTDSDIETSTEGEYYPSPKHGCIYEHNRFVSRKDSLISNMTDPGDWSDFSTRRRSSLRFCDVRDAAAASLPLRRSSLAGHQDRVIASTAKGFKVEVMRTRSLDASKDLLKAQKMDLLSAPDNSRLTPNFARPGHSSAQTSSPLELTPQSSELRSEPFTALQSKTFRLVMPETEIRTKFVEEGKQTYASDH